MLCREKLFLVSLVFTSFYHQVTLSKVKLLDASSDVMDVRYVGCRKEAMEKFSTALLEKELDKSEGLKKAWQKSQYMRTKGNCSSQIPGGTDEHIYAISVYQYGDVDFIKELDDAIETMLNVTMYEDNFHFKALHFLLMDSFSLLETKECKDVYILLDNKANLPAMNSEVRFSSFTVADSSLELIDLSDVTILKITTCFYINLGDQICHRNLGKILISPAEVFIVKSKSQETTDDGDHYTEVVLAQSTLKSNDNCLMISRSAAHISTQFLPLLVAFPLFPLCL